MRRLAIPLAAAAMTAAGLAAAGPASAAPTDTGPACTDGSTLEQPACSSTAWVIPATIAGKAPTPGEAYQFFIVSSLQVPLADITGYNQDSAWSEEWVPLYPCTVGDLNGPWCGFSSNWWWQASPPNPDLQSAPDQSFDPANPDYQPTMQLGSGNAGDTPFGPVPPLTGNIITMQNDSELSTYGGSTGNNGPTYTCVIDSADQQSC